MPQEGSARHDKERHDKEHLAPGDDDALMHTEYGIPNNAPLLHYGYDIPLSGDGSPEVNGATLRAKSRSGNGSKINTPGYAPSEMTE